MLALPLLQFICANFFPPQTGTYGDHCPVTVSGTTTVATSHGITGVLLGTTAGTTCVDYATGQEVARVDMEIVGVDPDDTVSIAAEGAPYPLLPESLIQNPFVTAQPVTISNGNL